MQQPNPPNAVPAEANQAAKSATKIRPSRADQEFLPAALEILETPPSPVMTALIWLLAAFVTTALLWAWIGRIDIIAIAQGKIQPPGRVKIVQPVEAGKVAVIQVANGDKVTKGETLVVLEQEEARADVNDIATSRLNFKAEIYRRSVAAECALSPAEMSCRSKLHWLDEIPESLRQREEAVLFADLAQLRAQINSIDSQVVVKQSELSRLTATLSAQTTLVKTLQKRVDMRSTLAETGTASKANVIDSQETLQRETAILVGEKGQREETESVIKSLAVDREKQTQMFIADEIQKRNEASKQLDDFEQRLIKANNRLKHLTLTSPADGTVQSLSVFTIGQVVTAGQEIMRIVPSDVKLEIEAYLPNKDIGFIELGQEVSIKVESFPFTRYGMLKGRVSHIAHDAIPLPEAIQIEGNSAQSTNSSVFAGAERTQNLVFPLTIALDQPVLIVDGKAVQMSPGMTVSAEIKTGNRRILEYVFSPLAETTAEAMKER